MRNSIIQRLFHWFLNERFKERFETIIIYAGLAGFAIHLLLIFLTDLAIFKPAPSALELFEDPISAIYTPFSFILIYEVYLLVFYLPTSFTSSIGKQYEIISLIIIRRIFKDIAQLEFTSDWYTEPHNISLATDMSGFLLLFALILVFYYLAARRPRFKAPENVQSFISLKKGLSVIMILVLFALAIYSLVNWGLEIQRFNLGKIEELSDVNKIFYNEFFTTLILVDVVILMVSFRYTAEYHQLIRNSGFVISTILIRLSFSATGLLNMVLILSGVLFGCLVLVVSNQIGRTKLQEDGVDD